MSQPTPASLFVQLPPDPGPEDLPTSGPGFFVYLAADGLSYYVEALDPADLDPWTWPGRRRPAPADELAAALAAGGFELWTGGRGAGGRRFAI